MAEINDLEDIVVPETPKLLDNEVNTIYVPVATDERPGIARFSPEHFNVIDGVVRINEDYVPEQKPEEEPEEKPEEDSNTGGSGTFIATYGQTSYADILSAWKSGMNVILKGDVESALTVRMLVHISTDKIFFGRVLAESKLVEEVIVTKSDSWSLIKNNYLTKDDLANISTGAGSKTVTRVFQIGSSGTIRCKPNTTYNFYCVDDTEATLRGYGTQNADKVLSGKYLTVHCGSKNDSFTDGRGTTITGSTAALWYATSMTKGTLTPIGSMEVKRGVLEHSDGNHYVEISYPASCSIIITENVELLSANGVSF